MANSGGIITAPVSFDDVRKVLGNASNHLGTLCTATNINKWSKHKPTSYPSLFPQNGVQWKGNGQDTIWGMYVDVLEGSSPYLAQDVYEDTTFTHYNWVYAKPVGGTNSPYRLADFDGYNHTVSGISFQGWPKDTTENIYVANTATETEEMIFAAYGSMTNGIGFSDIEEVTKTYPDEKLYLVVSVYKKNGGTFIADYFNNGIKLYESTTATVDTSLDSGNTYKTVKLKLPKSEYWGNGISTVDVYLTLQTIRKVGSEYQASKVIALPYSNDNYYKKSIYVFTAYRSIQCIKYHAGEENGARKWNPIGTPQRIYYAYGTPDLWFTVSKMPDETLTFKDGVCFLRSKYKRKKDGKDTIVSFTLSSQTGSQIPNSVTVPAGTSGYVDVFFHTGDMFQDYTAGQTYYPNSPLTAQIYLVKVVNGVETETHVGSVTLLPN